LAVASGLGGVSSAQWRPGLDLLRAAAISWVLIYHAANFDLLPEHPWLVKFGWMGVDLFFALSGFLIAGQLFRPLAEGEAPDLGRFFARRWLRTLPAYFAVLAVYALLPVARDRPALLPLWRFLTFTANIGMNVGVKSPTSFSHAWSLCVEEQFYLVLPLALMALGPRLRLRGAVAALAGVVALGMALRGWTWLHDVASTPFDIAAAPRSGRYMWLIYYPTWTRLDDLAFGVAAAAVQAFRPRWWAALVRRGDLLLAAGAAGVVGVSGLFGEQIAGFGATVLGFPLLGASMALLVIGASAPGSAAAALAAAPVRALAAGSYSLYLSHKIVFHAAQIGRAGHPEIPSQLWFAAALAGAVALGAALYWGVERPFLRLRNRGSLGARPLGQASLPAR
jgi:peptidoglycan/LPS O-acetylase OafA/YrhL